MRPSRAVKKGCLLKTHSAQNLLDPAHPEFAPGGSLLRATQVPRSVSHLLFVADTASRPGAEGVRTIRDLPVLTVSDEKSFSRSEE